MHWYPVEEIPYKMARHGTSRCMRRSSLNKSDVFRDDGIGANLVPGCSTTLDNGNGSVLQSDHVTTSTLT